MIKIVSVENIRQIEAAADSSGISYDTMMQNAGYAVAVRAIEHIKDAVNPRVTVLIGTGHNGGVGLVAGRIIAQESKALVRFYLLKPRSADDPNFAAVQAANLSVAQAQDDRDGRVLRNMVASADVVVDALFGIGVTLPLRSDVAKVMRVINQALNDTQIPEQTQGILINPANPIPHAPLPKPYVIAVDCPSGLDCDTGALDQNAIHADETVTFIAAKKGQLEFPGASAVGEMIVATIGLPADLPELKNVKQVLADSKLIHGLLPSRPLNANKGTFGKILIVAGSENYVGAAALTSMAAYRSGAGLVSVAAPKSVVSSLSGRYLEPTWLPLAEENGAIAADASVTIKSELETYDALLMGPGWGRAASTQSFMRSLFTQKPPHLVIDADALNLLSEMDGWWKQLPAETIITPHPGEMARLAKLSTEEVQANRLQLATKKAAEWNVILVLKGAHTLIAAPDGRLTALPYKSDALSTAGTGDVLAGMITGFLGQGISPYEAAILGGYAHGLAGNLAAVSQGTTRSVIASDVLDSIGHALVALSR